MDEDGGSQQRRSGRRHVHFFLDSSTAGRKGLRTQQLSSSLFTLAAFTSVYANRLSGNSVSDSAMAGKSCETLSSLIISSRITVVGVPLSIAIPSFLIADKGKGGVGDDRCPSSASSRVAEKSGAVVRSILTGTVSSPTVDKASKTREQQLQRRRSADSIASFSEGESELQGSAKEMASAKAKAKAKAMAGKRKAISDTESVSTSTRGTPARSSSSTKDFADLRSRLQSQKEKEGNTNGKSAPSTPSKPSVIVGAESTQKESNVGSKSVGGLAVVPDIDENRMIEDRAVDADELAEAQRRLEAEDKNQQDDEHKKKKEADEAAAKEKRIQNTMTMLRQQQGSSTSSLPNDSIMASQNMLFTTSQKFFSLGTATTSRVGEGQGGDETNVGLDTMNAIVSDESDISRSRTPAREAARLGSDSEVSIMYKKKKIDNFLIVSKMKTEVPCCYCILSAL